MACPCGRVPSSRLRTTISGGIAQQWDSPSTLAVPPRKERRLAAKARAAARGTRTEARKKLDKGGNFSAPAATELEGEDVATSAC